MAIEFSAKSAPSIQFSHPTGTASSTNFLAPFNPCFSALSAVDSSSPVELLNLIFSGHSGNTLPPIAARQKQNSGEIPWQLTPATATSADHPSTPRASAARETSAKPSAASPKAQP